MSMNSPQPLRSVLKHTNPSRPASPSGSPPLLSPPTLASASGASGAYTPKVSFDAFENPADNFSFTVQVKSDGYERTIHTRVFLCACSPDETGREALEWAIENLVQNGDELVVVRGFDEVELLKDQEAVRDDARTLMADCQKLNTDCDPARKLSLVVEFVAGKVTATIERMIALYRPDSLVVGTRGKQRPIWGAALGIGSVSKWCLSHSPVPVIVVRPEIKVRKAVEKRRADPKRGTHFEGIRSATITPVSLPTSP